MTEVATPKDNKTVEKTNDKTTTTSPDKKTTTTANKTETDKSIIKKHQIRFLK